LLAGAAEGGVFHCVIVAKEGRACTMAEKDFDLPVTLRRIVRQDRDHSIFPLAKC
jgi:hypothetical protein